MNPTASRTEAQKQRVFERRLARQARRVRGRRFTNAFILFHIGMLAVWLLPYNLPLVQTLVPPEGGGWVRGYIIGSGFEQSWQMFSPNPDTHDLDIIAHVTLQNGQTRDWRFPRMRDMGYLARYRRERMRKYLEIANYHETLWLPMALYAARQCSTIPGNPPAAVRLTRYTRDVPPPGRPLPPYTRTPFFQTALTPQELR